MSKASQLASNILPSHMMPGYVILVRIPGDNNYRGLVEESFSLGASRDRTQLFWSGNAVSNFGTKHVLDGKKDAEERVEYYKKLHPDWTFEVYDATDENLPVTLDWEQWHKDCAPADTLSGVRDKYGARNLKFATKDI